MSDDPHRLLERFFPAMFGDDAETLRELLHADVVWHVPPFASGDFGPLVGREAVVGFLCSAGDAYYQPGTTELDVEVQAVEDDRAVVVGQMRARLPSGAPYDNRYAFAFRFADDAIREIFELLDSVHFERQQERDAARRAGAASPLAIRGFQRVELVVGEDEIERAVAQFNEVLGTRLPRPIAIEGHPVLSSTDFEGSIELVAAVGGEGPFADRGPGAIGPVVWEIGDFAGARTWLGENGYRISFEYDSTQGSAAEASTAVRQLVLDPEQWFGFHVTLMERASE